MKQHSFTYTLHGLILSDIEEEFRRFDIELNHKNPEPFTQFKLTPEPNQKHIQTKYIIRASRYDNELMEKYQFDCFAQPKDLSSLITHTTRMNPEADEILAIKIQEEPHYIILKKN